MQECVHFPSGRAEKMPALRRYATLYNSPHILELAYDSDKPLCDHVEEPLTEDTGMLRERQMSHRKQSKPRQFASFQAS
jgi:hypothetical protein